MKNYTLALISLLIFIGSNVKAEDASVLAKQEAQMQVLAELERLAKQDTRLAAAQKSIFLVIKRERDEERRLCMSKWKDSAFAKVWPMSAWGKKDGRNWNALKYEEKEFFKHLCVEKYIDKKIPELNLPKLRISENEYSEAWGIIHLHASNAKQWGKISDFNLKSQFRKEYHDYKVSLVGESHFPLHLDNKRMPLIASIIPSSSKVIL